MTTPLPVVFVRPLQGQPNAISTVTLGTLTGSFTIPPAPATSIFLSDGTPVNPGGDPDARQLSGIVYNLITSNSVIYRLASTPSASEQSTTGASRLPSQASATPTTTQAPNSDVNSGTLIEPTGSHTAPTPTHTAKSEAKSGLQPGAAAGLAIGCLLAGIIIAGALFWFLCGRRRRSQSRYPEDNSTPLVAQEKGFSNRTTALHGNAPAAAVLSNSLPQPMEDRAISGDISKISNSIKNHVQSYYHTSRVTPALIDHDDLQALGPKMPITIGTLSTLLGNSATREIALRFCIAWAVVSRMQESSAQSNGLLPAEIAGCLQQITKTHSSSPQQAIQASQWRTMTAELMQSTYVRNPFTSSDSRNTSIRGITQALDNVLQPYADSRMDNEQRKHNLEEVIKRSALFAFTLFSQPSLWEFDWKEEQGVKSGELCIFPALVQVADESGEAVRPPRPFSEAVVRRLDT